MTQEKESSVAFGEALSGELVKSGTTAYNINNILLHFLAGGRIRGEDALDIVQKASALLRKEENVIELSGPITIVGDINGQFHDLAKILSIHGPLRSKRILFLGNYIGSGGFSCQCVLLLLAAKLAYPRNVFLLRGNHESRFGASLTNLEMDCSIKYPSNLFTTIIAAFHCLPLAAVVSKKYFCVHGGLSRDISRISDLQFIQRFREIPVKGAMCDLLWSDPYWDVDNPTTTYDKTGQSQYFTPGSGPYETQPMFFENEQRGCGLLFNYACVRHFNSMNHLVCVIRSHECQDDGYRLYRVDSNSYFPTLITIFSAPNYGGTFENKGAILMLGDDSIEFRQFFCSPHPYVLQNMNAISWSLPYMVDSLDGILKQILGAENDDDK